MTTPLILSSIGLCLDIVGAVLIFKYGMPSRYMEQHPQNLTILGANKRWPDDEYEKIKSDIDKRNWHIKFFANAGLILLIIGFILQFCGVLFQST